MQPRPVYLMDSVADMLPKDLWLTRMEEKTGGIRLRGHDVLLHCAGRLHGQPQGLGEIQGRGSRGVAPGSHQVAADDHLRGELPASRSEPWPSSIRFSRLLPRPQKIAIGVVGLVILAALGFFIFQPKSAERDALWNRTRAAGRGRPGARRRGQPPAPSGCRPPRCASAWKLAKERLPLEREIPALYRQVSDPGAQSGLGVALFQPRAAEDKAILTELPIAVIAESGYHQLGAFFDQVGRLPRHREPRRLSPAGIDRPTGTVRAELTHDHLSFPAGRRAAGRRHRRAPPKAPAPSAGPGGSDESACARTGYRDVPGHSSARCGSGIAPPAARTLPTPSADASGNRLVAPKEPEPGPALAPDDV